MARSKLLLSDDEGHLQDRFGLARAGEQSYHAWVTYTFRYNEEEAIEALLFNRKKGLWICNALIVVMFLLIGVQALIAGAWDTVLWVAALAIAVPLAVFWRQKYAYRKVFRASPLSGGDVVAEIDAEGIKFSYPLGRGSQSLAWSSFSSWQESGKAFILYTQRVPLRILPKNGLVPAQVDELRSIISAHVANA